MANSSVKASVAKPSKIRKTVSHAEVAPVESDPAQTVWSSQQLQQVVENPRAASAQGILALQRTYGNQAVQRLLKSHPKPASPPRPHSPVPVQNSPVQRDFTEQGKDAELKYTDSFPTEEGYIGLGGRPF